MKTLITALLCMLLCVPAFADQQTTVLSSPVNIKKATGFLPFIDGSNDPVLEKEANSILQKYAEELVDKVGNKVNPVIGVLFSDTVRAHLLQ